MAAERLGGLGRGNARIWDDSRETRIDRDWATANGQDDWADELEAEADDNDWRTRVLNEGMR